MLKQLSAEIVAFGIISLFFILLSIVIQFFNKYYKKKKNKATKTKKISIIFKIFPKIKHDI